MDAPGLAPWLDIAGTGSVLVVFWVVFRAWIGETRKDRDFWRTLALRSTKLLEGYSDTTDKAVDVTENVLVQRLAAIEKALLGRTDDH